ncbi:MAG: iron ABC transporter permease [Tissierellia bacterium]|nr:iron ABC transporter permease [Tissierellia bacterium]
MKKFFIRDGRLQTRAYIILILLPIVCTFLSICMGRIYISPKKIINLFIDLLNRNAYEEETFVLVMKIRLPGIITALLVGGGLSLSGLSFQAIFTNPLATPDILGVSSAASLGAIIGILLSKDLIAIQFLGLIFGFLAVIIAIKLAKIGGERSIIQLVLSGIIMSSLFNALGAILKYTADPYDKLPQITYWLMGSFARSSYKGILLALPFTLLGIIIIFALKWQLNILSLSDDEAKSMGINLNLMRFLFILASTMITASSIAICGQIGWMGLIIPHISRLLIGADNRHLAPFCLSIGSAVMVLIEAFSRTASVISLPISTMTAIIGAPIFLFAMKQNRGVS